MKRAEMYAGLLGSIRRASKLVTRSCFINAYAEEAGGEENPDLDGGGEGADGGSHGTVNFEDLVTKARAEEKRKQYGKIQKLEQERSELVEKNNSLMLKVGELEQSLEEEKKKLTKASSGDSEEVKTLKAEIDTLKADLEKANGELKAFKDKPPVNREDVEKEVRAELEKEFEVRTYRAEQIAQYANDPTVLVELVTGETKEDIDATLKAALERSKEIKKSLGLNLDGTPDQRRTTQPNFLQNQPIPQLNTTVQTPAGGAGGSDDILQQMATMDVSSPEYAKLRKQLGL